MKKLSLLFIAITLAFAALLGTVLTACDDDKNETKYQYSVTVYEEDMTTPVPDVTVKWSQSGTERASAVTGADGKAEAELALSSYDVTLHGLSEGMTSSAATATATARSINLVIKKAEVNYTASVLKSDGTPASGVTVSWTAGNTIAGTAVTGSDGTASKPLAYGNYSVTLSNLPEGNVFVGSKQVTGAQPAAEFRLSTGVNVDYTVTVRSEGGLLFKEYSLTAYRGQESVATAKTDDKGNAAFSLAAGYDYTVEVLNVPEGYSFTPASLTEANTNAELVLRSEVISSAPAENTEYVIGDIIHDYEFTTPYEVDGKKLTYKISEILKEKEAIVLNFWGTNCSACVLEMPAMEEAYAKYKDRVEFLGISNYLGGDSDSTIVNYRESNGYTYPMFRDPYNFTGKFVLSAWPTNVIIDRYGAIAKIEEGALTKASMWEKLLDKYVGDDYTQTFIPGNKRDESSIIENARPDVTAPEGHYEAVAEAINGTKLPADAGCSISWFGEPEESAEFTWPFLLKDYEGGKVLYPSNTAHDSTFSFIYANVTMTAGRVFAFDYLLQSEADIDKFYVLFDGKVIYELSGMNSEWKTCYVYVDIVTGTHQLALSYIKDEDKAVGIDAAYIRNARFVDIAELDNLSTSILRPAAYGTPEANATSYPYYASVSTDDEGYYRVNTASLENSWCAGKDASPMLFVSLLSSTSWSPVSVFDFITATDDTTGEYKYDFNFNYLGKDGDWRDLIGGYCNLANKSDLQGYLPVTEQLKELLIAFTRHISGTDAHENEWLELCYFYSVYGTATPVGNPIIGLTEETAIEISANQTYTADLTKNVAPFPVKIYAFTPEASGIYEIQSFIPDDKANIYASQVWIYDEDSSADEPLTYVGDDRINRDGENEQNFDVNMYLLKDRKYYIAVAYLMQERANLDFSVTYTGKQSLVELTDCTSGDYVMDDSNNMALRYAVDYVKDDDGYYRVKNSDGSAGDYIYVDFKYTTQGNVSNTLTEIIDQWVTDPNDSEITYFKVFDFRQSIVYETVYTDEDGNRIYNYSLQDTEKFDPDHADDYVNYTDIMREYSRQALANTGREDGLIKADDTLVKILTLYHLLRTDSIFDGVMPTPIEDEWLRFCWYYKTIDASNPV